MKNFFKKLSFVLALAMVLTSIAPATASAATKDYIAVKGGKQASTVYVFIGGVSCDLDFSGSTKGTWKSADESIAKVDKNGVITPVANGKVKISFVSKDGKTLAKQTVRVCTRAAKLNVYDYAEYAAGTKNVLNGGEYKMTVGEKKDLQITMPISKAKKAAGAKSSSYASYCTAISDEAVVAVTKKTDRLYTLEAKAAGEATVTIAANQTSQANVYKNSKFVEAKFTVKVAGELAAEQTGTNVITVTGSNLSDKVADYTLKFGSATKTLASVSVNADKTIATITVGSSTMVEGVYTLTFGDASVELPCGPSVVKEIVIEPDMAIYVTSTSAVAYFKVFNQFGENITKKVYNDLSVTGSDSVNGTATYNAENEDAKVTFTNSTTGYNLNLSQVSLSIVDKTNGVVCSKVLTVCEAAKLKTVEVAGVYKVTGGTYKKVDSIPEGTSSTKIADYKILLTGKDQYGRAFDTTKFNQNNISLTLSSVTGLFANVTAGSGNSAEVELDGVKYGVVDLSVNNSTGKLVAGDVSALGVVLTSGTQFTSSITVADAVKIASISISAQDGVYGGQNNTLSYTVLDTNGNEVTDIDTLCKLNNADYLKDFPKVKFVGTASGKAKLVYTAASTSTNNTDTLSWISPTLQYGYTTLNIKPDRKPVAVVGIWSKPETGFNIGSELATTSGGTISIPKTNFKYEDQYGNLYQWWENSASLVSNFDAFTVTRLSDKANYVTDDLTAGVVATAGAVATSSTIKYKVATEIQLPAATNVTKNEYEFTIAFAEINDVTGLYAYTYGDTYYVTSQSSANVYVAVGGFYAGKALTLQGTDYASVKTTLDTIDPNKSGYDVTLEDTVKVVVNNNEGTVLSVPVKRSNEAAKIVYANAYDGGCAFSGGYATVTHAAAEAVKTEDNCVKTTFGNILNVKDQYGYPNAFGASAVADATSPRVTFSNLPADTAKYTLVNNGKTNAMLTFTEAGWYTVKATFDWAGGYTYSTVLVYEVK